MQIDPTDSDVLWAGNWNRQGGDLDTLFVSRDRGESWSAVTGEMQGSDIDFMSFTKSAGLTYVSAFGKGLRSSDDKGESGKPLNDGLRSQLQITLVTAAEDRAIMYTATHDFGVFRSIDRGTSWTAANQGKEPANDVHGLAVHVFSVAPNGKEIIMGTGQHGEGTGTLYRTWL